LSIKKGSTIIPFDTPILEQFCSFCQKNNIKDIEKAIEYFAVFGGLDDKIDTNIELSILVKTLILDKYKILHPFITKITHSSNINHSILSAVALGDGRIHSVLKRAKVSRDEGVKAIDFLLKSGLIREEKSKTNAFFQENQADDKLFFTLPFMRFWFAFISPIYKGVAQGNYDEFEERFKNRADEFGELIFEQLSLEVLKQNFEDVKEASSYWNKEIQLPIYMKLSTNQSVIGLSKYSKQKMKKDSLTKLQNFAKELHIKNPIFVLVSKNSFSSELKALKSQEIQLYSIKNFKYLC
jgi:hypothetical protein